MKRVVVVGMGFGGISAVHELGGRGGVEVTVIDRRNYHLFQALLYQVATAALDQDSIVYPIRAVLRHWSNTRFFYANVTDVDLEAREVVTDHGRVPYDYLVLSPGSEVNFYGLESVRKHSLTLKTLYDSVLLRNHILALFEEASRTTDPDEHRRLLTFAVVGAGATGVELCGALAELIRDTLKHDYPELDVGAARIILIEALDKVLPMMPPKLQEYTARRLQDLGVEIMLGKMVTDTDGRRVMFKDGSELETRTLVWSAGVKASGLVDCLGAPKAGAGRVRVEPDMTIHGHPEVFAIGDMAYVEVSEGECLPMVAPVAKQQGEYVAETIVRRERGEMEREPFRYVDRGFMAIIGRYSAVATPFGMQMKGFPAWVMWLLLHLVFLVGFRNRIIAMLNWVGSFLLRNPRVRLITREFVPETVEEGTEVRG